MSLAVQIERNGGPEEMKLVDVAVGEPGKGDQPAHKVQQHGRDQVMHHPPDDGIARPHQWGSGQ